MAATMAESSEDEIMERKMNEELSFLPSKLLDRLMTFQKEGVIYALNRNGRCLFGDEMGLGKTLQALAVAYYYKEHWPVLIITPSSLRYPWIDEIEKWFPEIDPLDINLIQTGTDISNISTSRITVVTYGLLRCPSSTVLQEALLNQDFQMLIADESHYLKNRKSQTSKYLVPLIQRATHKVLLTGTPALARPEELFPQVDAICQGKFGSWSEYAKRFCDARWQYFGRNRRQWKTDGASNLQELESLLRYHCMIRRLKKNVLTQLPPKQRQKIIFPLKDSSLKKDLDQTWKELDASMGKGVTMNTVLDGVPGTNQQSRNTFEIHKLISTVYRKTAAIKIGPVKEYIKMMCANQDLKFLVFAHHHIMTDAISEQLHDEKIGFIRIDGNTDQQERPGLTLTAAKLVVFAELDWTPGVLQQCEDRAHRIGQQDTVHIHYLVAKGTLDEWVWSALARKTTVVSTTLNGKHQVLRMDEGGKGQIDCLANAEAWIPKKKEEIDEEDICSFFSSQQPKSQRSLLEFFTPKNKKRKSQKGSPGTPESARKKRKKSKESQLLESPPLVLDILEDSDSVVEGKKSRELDVIHVISDSDSESLHDTQSPYKCSDSAIQTPTSCSKLSSEVRHSNANELNTAKTKVTKKRECPLDTSADDFKVNSNEWSCNRCTFLNHEKLLICEMCSTRRSTTRQIRGSTVEQEKTRLKKNKSVKSTEPVATSSKESTQTIQRKSSKIKFVLQAPKTDNNIVKKKSKKRDSGDDFTGLWGLGPDLLDSDFEADPLEPSCSDGSIEERSMTNAPDGDCRTDQGSDTEEITNIVDKPYNDDIASPLSKSVSKGAFSTLNDNGGREENEHEAENTCVDDITKQEIDAATMMFGSQNEESLDIPWTCAECGIENSPVETDCEGCLATRPKDVKRSQAVVEREVNLDEVPAYERFQYGCSKNTSRVYLYDDDGVPLNVNFLPLDVEMQNYSALPDLLLHPHNLRHVNRFVREWNSLAATKRRVIVKSGEIFANPLMVYENIKMGRVQSSRQRFTMKADIAASAVSKASEVNGSIRIVKPSMKPPKRSSATSRNEPHTSDSANTGPPQNEEVSLPETVEEFEKLGGMVQAVDGEGRPLCVSCQKPYVNKLVSERTVKENPWQTRFCSQTCAEQLWTRRHGTYTKRLVYELELGICQMCGLDAQEFFKRIRVTKDHTRRAEIIKDSVFNRLKPEIKAKMVCNPHKGQFWQVDHITAVADGGGECDVDNLRTLCTCCHRDVTARQNKERAEQRRKNRPNSSKKLKTSRTFSSRLIN